MHIRHYEDLCKVATETEKITFLSDIAAVSAKNIKTTVVIRQWLFYCRYWSVENYLSLTFRGNLINSLTWHTKR